MSLSDGRARLAADPDALARLEALLLLYPSTTPDETGEIGALLRAAGPLDTGLLSANALAWTKAEQYRRDFPDRFRMGWRERGFWLVTLLLVVAALILGWDAAVP